MNNPEARNPETYAATEETSESVDELRQRLNRMKKLMSERNSSFDGSTIRRINGPGVIDGNFLSVMFGVALAVIVSVSVYAFYNLFVAIWKRHARYHEEL
ncbi:hypothetical protein GWI33_019627 [Rhynchophorus ferrugineus]|uniref:Uncharacterized protein n=1 Tax=Rhynchophorus ferrugineus TaxID=354439 RepID=A0A834M6V3_RHYFE|nr:hypothetical protein GWI33_019627 [Rhynchophorus ferrugineus]